MTKILVTIQSLTQDKNSLYWEILKTRKENSDIIQLSLPALLISKLNFILLQGNSSSYIRQLSWVLKILEIEKNNDAKGNASSSELALSDVARSLIASYSKIQCNKLKCSVPQELLLLELFIYAQTTVTKTLLKTSIFFDWIGFFE